MRTHMKKKKSVTFIFHDIKFIRERKR